MHKRNAQSIIPPVGNCCDSDRVLLIVFTTKSINKCKSWLRVALHPIGGLTEVGVTDDESHLLVVSHSGRGVIDLRTGVRVARDDDIPLYGSSWINDNEKLVRGIGPIEDAWVNVVGLWGGQLAGVNENGWSVQLEPHKLFELAYIKDARQRRWLVDKAITKVAAFGFSGSGRLLILATSSDVAIYDYNA